MANNHVQGGLYVLIKLTFTQNLGLKWKCRFCSKYSGEMTTLDTDKKACEFYSKENSCFKWCWYQC